ncbi:MAG TPA: 2,4-dienoyl-CoA reductase FMN-binding domain-containing protein, partial [Microbacteriaceae bacterium]|nr:2,4-dienoyl-CoA reductase FMN-binding domain-containing protein [Microbacteriaceae bacterium]
MTQYPSLFTPIRIGAHKFSNRIMMGSMHLGHEEHPDGFERMAAFYQERVRGGTRLIVTGGISPNTEGALSLGGASMQTSADAAKHKIITDAIHDAGGTVLLQLLHAGRYSKQPNLVAPSAIRAPINQFEPRQMSEADILRTIDDYATASKLALEAGYDGVEVMGSEGYLINTFLAPLTNQRTDRWGGDAAGRRLFALEVTRAVREALHPDSILSFRISMTDLVPNGCTNEELLELAGELEKTGVNMFVTGIGWHESRVPTIATSVPRAAFSEFTAMLTNHVSVPVAATNRINTPEVAESILSSGQADLVALARPLLADPAFATKAGQGQADTINPCIACNQACLDHVLAGKLTSCLVNPRAGNETTLVL